MAFVPSIAEQRLMLEHIVRLAELSDVAADVVDSVLEGIGAFAAGEWAPLDRLGDLVGPKWTGQGVKMPAGYAEAYQSFVRDGWGSIGSPAGFGGQGLPLSLAAAVLETLGTANLGFGLAPILTIGAIEALAHHGTDEQRAVYLPKLSTGEWTGTMNLTEPQSGSDLSDLKTRAEPADGGKWKIKGTKIFISFGDHDMTENIVHLVLARTPGAPSGSRGLSLFIVPKYRPDKENGPGEPNGVRTVSIEHKLGLHASPTCVLSFGDEDDCLGELLGAEGGGLPAMFTMMNNARLNVALQGVQVAERATQQAITYACERIQGSRGGSRVAVIEHPDVRRMLLRMRAQTAAARALAYFAFGQLDRARAGDPMALARVELLTPVAKAHCTDIGNDVASLGIQVHGGMGFMEETGAAQHFRDARILPIYEGTNGIQAADLVGRKLMADNGAALFALIEDMRRTADASELRSLIDTSEEVACRLLAGSSDDRLAASYPFLKMLATAVCGWLLEDCARRVNSSMAPPSFIKMMDCSAAFYLQQILPEASGLRAAAMAPSDMLYSLEADDFRAKW